MMTKEEIISKFQAKRDEGQNIRTSIDALMPIQQIDRYRFEYRSVEVNILRNSLSLWQKQVYYMLLGIFGNKHSIVREFAITMEKDWLYVRMLRKLQKFTSWFMM